jgi:hypothetical protein
MGADPLQNTVTTQFVYTEEEYAADCASYEEGKGTPKFTQLKNDVQRFVDDNTSAIERKDVAVRLSWFS